MAGISVLALLLAVPIGCRDADCSLPPEKPSDADTGQDPPSVDTDPSEDTGAVGPDTGGGGGVDTGASDDTGGQDTAEQDSEPVDDQDGDGYSTAEGDCNDAAADIGPDAVDFAGDGVDLDCDGVDGEDEDGDGHASQGSGGSDCNDSDGTVYPGAEDMWYDGVDSDCGGDSDYDQDGDGEDSADHGGWDCDDTDPAEDGGGIWYADADDDSYGDPDTYAETCDRPDGYVPNQLDCDDGSYDINLGTPELWGDGVDNDCDGDTDEEDSIEGLHSGSGSLSFTMLTGFFAGEQDTCEATLSAEVFLATNVLMALGTFDCVFTGTTTAYGSESLSGSFYLTGSAGGFQGNLTLDDGDCGQELYSHTGRVDISGVLEEGAILLDVPAFSNCRLGLGTAEGGLVLDP
jgi:hypothetical protein